MSGRYLNWKIVRASFMALARHPTCRRSMPQGLFHWRWRTKACVQAQPQGGAQFVLLIMILAPIRYQTKTSYISAPGAGGGIEGQSYENLSRIHCECNQDMDNESHLPNSAFVDVLHISNLHSQCTLHTPSNNLGLTPNRHIFKPMIPMQLACPINLRPFIRRIDPIRSILLNLLL